MKKRTINNKTIRLIFKVIGWFSGVLFAFILLLFLVAFFLEESITQRVLREINKSLESKISVENIHFSFINQFPDASLRFSNICIYEAKTYDSKGTDTLAYFNKLYLNLNIISLLTNHIKINEISAHEGIVNLKINKNNQSNFDIFKSGTQDTNSFEINANKIKVFKCKMEWADHTNQIYIKNDISNLRLSGYMSNLLYTAKINSDLENVSVQIGDIRIFKNKKLTINTSFTNDQESFNLGSASILSDNNKIRITGYQQKSRFNYTFTSKSFHLNTIELSSFLPKHVADSIGLSGKVDLSISIKNNPVVSKPPIIFVLFNVPDKETFINFRNTGINISKSKGEVNWIGNQLHIRIHPLQLHAHQSFVNIDGTISILDSIRLNVKTLASIKLDDWMGLINPKVEQKIGGQIDWEFDLKSTFSLNDSLSDYIKKIKIHGNTRLSNLSIVDSKNHFYLENGNGNFQVSNLLNIQDFSLVFNKVPYHIDGTIPVTALLNQQWNGFDFNVETNQLVLDSFFRVSSTLDTIAILPKWNGTIKFKINRLQYFDTDLKDFQVKLKFNSGLILANYLVFNTLNGHAQSKAILSTENDYYKFHIQSNIENIDVSRMFRSFNNFGQNTLMDKHLKGNISGQINLSGLISGNGNILASSIKSQSILEATNGELIGFEPLMGLSSFVKIEDLRHIRFSKMKNSVHIENKRIDLPEMDINTNALNLRLYGYHQFDNQFEYHIRLALTDVLFNKFRKSNTQIDPNENISRENKQTFLYFIIKGNFDNFEVKYDKKNARDQFKKILTNEKNTLKSIFHEEFNAYSSSKSDSIHEKLVAPKIEHDEILPVKVNQQTKNSTPKSSAKAPKMEEWKDE